METTPSRILEPEHLTWTEQIYARVPLSPGYVGLLIGVVLLVTLVVYEWSLGRFALIFDPAAVDPPIGEFRIAVVHCFMVSVAPTAYVMLIQRTRRTWVELQGLLGLSDAALEDALARVGRRPRWALALMLMAGLMLSLAVIYWTTPSGAPFDLTHVVPEVVWHRVLAPIVVLYVVWVTLLMIISSWQLSETARRIDSIDLLDRGAVAPFRSQALMHSLAVFAMAACASPLGVEPHLVPLIISIWIFATVNAVVALLLPLIGIRSVIRAGRDRELAWCDSELRRARDALKTAGASAGAGRFAEISEYRHRLEDVSEWPLDAPSFVRFALYLLLPLGSWIGGALVERVVDAAAQ